MSAVDRRTAPLVGLVLATLAVRAGRGADPRRLTLADTLAAPSWAHPFGCGEGGVDLLALASEAIVRGLALAGLVAGVAMIVGTTLGAVAGSGRAAWSEPVARLCDTVQALPSFVLALGVLSAIRTPTRVHVALVLAATAWAPFTRLALAEMRVVRTLAYVEAARALGATPSRVLVRHILPALSATAFAQLGTTAAALLVSDASLAFLGLGPSDGVSLGALIDQGVGAMVRAPHVLIVGSVALLACTSAFLASIAPRERGLEAA